MALSSPLLDRLQSDAPERESLSEAAVRMGAFAQSQSLDLLTAIAAEPEPAEAADLAARASDHAELVAAEAERFLALLPRYR